MPPPSNFRNRWGSAPAWAAVLGEALLDPAIIVSSLAELAGGSSRWSNEGLQRDAVRLVKLQRRSDVREEQGRWRRLTTSSVPTPRGS